MKRLLAGGIAAAALAAGALWVVGNQPSDPPISAASAEPSNPGASPEARALLRLLHDVRGRAILTGQQDGPRAPFFDHTCRVAGSYPAILGHDFSYAHRVALRPGMVETAVRHWARGGVVSFMYHATRPIDDPTDDFDSVTGRLTPAQWDSLLTPGTRIHGRWLAQIDSVAGYLAELRDAGVPVLWRPYHEMNGAWFWWGMRGGEYRSWWRGIYRRFPHIIDPLTDLISQGTGPARGVGDAPDDVRHALSSASVVPVSLTAREQRGYRDLWRLMYERYTHHHGLDNLLWVWSVSTPGEPGVDLVDPIAPYYPGHEFVDVLALDAASGALAEIDPGVYEELERLGQGKPVGIAEIGRLSDPAELAADAPWVFAMVWRNNIRTRNTEQSIRRFYSSPVALSLGDLRRREWRPGLAPMDMEAADPCLAPAPAP